MCRRRVVTGAAGVFGCAVTPRLLGRAEQIIAIDRVPLESGTGHVRGDLAAGPRQDAPPDVEAVVPAVPGCAPALPPRRRTLAAEREGARP